MSKVLITEADRLNLSGLQVIRPGETQAVTYAAATNSSALADSTQVIRVIADADVYLAFGTEADANSVRVPANFVEYFAVIGGEVISCYDGVT